MVSSALNRKNPKSTPLTETVSLWRLGEIVSAVAAGGFVVRRLDEFPSLSTVRRHDPRVPGEFALLAVKPDS